MIAEVMYKVKRVFNINYMTLYILVLFIFRLNNILHAEITISMIYTQIYISKKIIKASY